MRPHCSPSRSRWIARAGAGRCDRRAERLAAKPQTHRAASARRALKDPLLRPSVAARATGTAYGIALALFATLLGTWTDEEYTLATTAHGLVYAWHRAIDFELQAPLYFAMLALWREANGSVWFARFFSIVCATGFFFALLPLLRRIRPERDPLLPALLVALNPFAIYCALDIRLYAPALLVSALGYRAFEDGFAFGTSARARVSFVMLAIVALYTQYFLGFALVGYAAMLLVRGRFRALVPYAFALAAIGLAAIPLLGILHSQIGGSGETTAGAPELLRVTLLHPWLEFVLPHESIFGALKVRWPYVALVAALLGMVLYARPRPSPAWLGALACVGTIELLFVAVVLVFRLDLEWRHFVVLFVPLLVAGYALLADLGRSRLPVAATVGGGIYALAVLVALFFEQGQVAQQGDTLRVAAFLQAHAAPGAVIAVFPADALPAYARQFRNSARLVPFPNALPTQRYDLNAIDVHGEEQARAALNRLRSAPQVWLVMLGDCDGDATPSTVAGTCSTPYATGVA